MSDFVWGRSRTKAARVDGVIWQELGRNAAALGVLFDPLRIKI